MTPRVCWILSVSGRSCGLLFSQLLSCIVGLSSAGSTKPCRIGISHTAKLYSAVWSKRGFHNGLLFGQAMFLNSPVCYVRVCFASWELGELLDWKVQTRTQYRKLWKYDRDNHLCQNCSLVVIERAGSNQTVENLFSSFSISLPLPPVCLFNSIHSCAWCD